MAPLLLSRTQTLISTIVTEFDFEAADSLGQRLAKKKLEARPLIDAPDLANAVEATFRTSTVHKVKGESLDAMLYVAEKPTFARFWMAPAQMAGSDMLRSPERATCSSSRCQNPACQISNRNSRGGLQFLAGFGVIGNHHSANCQTRRRASCTGFRTCPDSPPW